MKRLIALMLLVAVLWLPYASMSRAQTTVDLKLAVVLRQANLRDGPGVSFPVVDTVKTDDVFVIVDQDEAGDWYELDSGAWIAAFLVRVIDATVPLPPTPTATPTPTVDVTEIKRIAGLEAIYVAKLQGLSRLYTAAFAALETRLTAAEQEPFLLTDEQWRTPTLTLLTLIQSLGNDGRALVPPERFQSVNADLLTAIEHYDSAAASIINKINAGDAALLVVLQQVLPLGNEVLEQANTQAATMQPNTAAPVDTPTPTAEIIATETPLPTETPVSPLPTPVPPAETPVALEEPVSPLATPADTPATDGTANAPDASTP